MKLSKKIKGAAAAIAVVGILGTAGTFAWTSISQRALNEGTLTVNPGGRVHDDYEGFENILASNGGSVNKDIFAENYSNKAIYVRIKLTEYMEVGVGAGMYERTGDNNTMTPKEGNQAVVLENAGLDGATMNDRATWPAYLPEGVLANGSKTSKLRDHITWSLGDKNADRKVYMPTFNQNNTNLESDTTGKAIEELTWTMNGNYDTTQNPLPGTHNQWTLDETHVSNLKKNDDRTDEEVVTPGVQHKAVETLKPGLNNGYMTMAEWLAEGQVTGNFWVHDNNGWIYWANPIKGNSATSLLLDKFDVSFPTDDMYYAINVISDFATSDDLDTWTDVTPSAKNLLTRIK